MYPRRGPGGSFGPKDSAGRELDAAGKLKKQLSRPDLKGTDYIDPDRNQNSNQFKVNQSLP